jgi:predicted MPP superfamily phosphohydrolase
VKWLGRDPLYAVLLLTEKPAGWPAWQVALLPLALASLAGLVWARVGGDPAWGWSVGLGLLALALLDAGFLALLPRVGASYGPPQPPFLGLVLLRWALAMLAALPAAWFPATALAVLAIVQLLLVGLMVYGTLVEPFRLEVTCLGLQSARLANPGPPLRIVQVSDLHIERLTRRDRALPGLIEEMAPDLIALTGDFLNESYNNEPQALAGLRSLVGQMRAPAGMYGIWGTEELDIPEVLRPLLSDLGVVVLENEAVLVTVGEHRLWIMGVNCTRDLAIDGFQLRTLMEAAPPGAFTLLLYHTPDLMPQAAELGVDLYLAGHTHGGQWRLPGFGAIVTSSHYGKRYEAGHYQQDGTHLYVSRGLGMEGFGAPRARLFCRPELVSITVSGQAGGS